MRGGPHGAVGATIRIFLVDGTPQGLRLVDRPGWTGSCLAFARADYAEARRREELARTGVYVLVGPDPSGARGQKVYVGEADEVRSRLDSHQKEKDFWTHGYVLTTKDDSLNKAHVRYLEARLIAVARAADNATLENGTAPAVKGLGEPEIADMESYLDNSLMLFPLVGVNVFDVIVQPVPAESLESGGVGSQAESAAMETPTRLFLRTKLTDAEGSDDPRGFLVYEGALARTDNKVMLSSYEALRARLVREGILVPHGAEQLRLTKNFIFDSPSAAASVLSGGSKNGRTEWRDASGRTLRELQEASTS